MPRLGMCSNNLNYLQNKTSRLYHIRRMYKNVKCKNKNVLEVLKSLKYISRIMFFSRILKLPEHFYFYILHFVYVRRMW